MKFNTTTKSKVPKIILISVVAALLLGGAAFAYVQYQAQTNKSNTDSTQPRPSGEVDYGPATDEQIQAGNDQKEGTLTDPGTSNSTGDIVVTVINLNATSTSFQMGTDLSIVTNTGTCTLTLKKGSTTVVKEAGIQAGPSTSTCKGFNFTEPLSAGTWTATVSVVSGDRKGAVSQEFTVQ